MSEINVMDLRKGDIIKLRCGGEAEIVDVDFTTHDTMHLIFEGGAFQHPSWFFDGKYAFEGNSPLDIVGVKHKLSS